MLYEGELRTMLRLQRVQLPLVTAKTANSAQTSVPVSQTLCPSVTEPSTPLPSVIPTSTEGKGRPSQACDSMEEYRATIERAEEMDRMEIDVVRCV